MLLIESLKQVASLQPMYTYENTPEMQARMSALKLAASELQKTTEVLEALKSHDLSDIGVEASDGLGRKAEAPWIRIYSKYLSPSAREGFYLVIHFPIDGNSIYVTLGCGATKYENGSLRDLPVNDLLQRAGWARALLAKSGYLPSFPDQLDFGSTSSRPRAYANATAIAKKFPVDQINQDTFVKSMITALQALDELYDEQTKGSHLDEGDKQLALIEEAIKPTRTSLGRQGFGLTANQRKAVEMRGMLVATSMLEALDYQVTDVSNKQSFDLLAKKTTETRKIEVKASTSASLESIVMTHNEVKLHSDRTELTGLILVSGVELDRSSDTASGGSGEIIFDWSPDDWGIEPIAFRLSRVI